MTTTRQPECRPTCAARRDPNAECVCAELEAMECGAYADPRQYGATFTDPVCHEPAGHSGSHVGLHRDGTRTGFIRSAPAADVAAAHRITPYVAWDRDESDPCQRGTVGCSINHVEPHNWSCETW